MSSKRKKKNTEKRDKNERAFDGRDKTDFLIGREKFMSRRPFDEAIKDKGGQARPAIENGKKTDHARPLSNVKPKKGQHRPLKRGNPRHPPKNVVKAPMGKVPSVKGRGGKRQRMVPWIPIPYQADPTSYVLVIRELLEGKRDEPELGTRFMEMHDLTRMLTDSPRCRQDWRLVISVLRILLEEAVIDVSFVQTVLAEHPVLGHGKVKNTEDLAVNQDYVRSLTKHRNPKWEAAAMRKHKAVVATMMDVFVSQEGVRYPMVSREDILHNWVEPETAPFEYDDGRKPDWVNKTKFITLYKAKQAQRKADKLPQLWRLHGKVRIKKRSTKDGSIVTYRDEVDVEYWFKRAGGMGIGIANNYRRRGKKAQRVSPFRKQYCYLPELRDAPVHIDGEYVPKVHDRGIVRETPLTEPKRKQKQNGNAPEDESDINAFAESMGIRIIKETDDRTKRKRKQKQGAKRKAKPKRGKRGRYKKPDEED